MARPSPPHKRSPSPPRKRSPIKIPDTDKEALIANNLLTIIGRVTNPRFQRARAVVDIMPQIWNLEGRVEGRDLGPELFQFRFESESDLLSVLAKGPYHHKRWMLILQRWEPIVSPTFPSNISFWIRIHGIPLHYCSDQTLNTIGSVLGHVSSRDVRDARIRVDINGLLPLEMKSEIQLPSGEVTEIEFEYTKMEKHCFTCFSLSHEEDDCPQRVPGSLPAKDRKLGITQRMALERIEASKRRHDDRRGYKHPTSRPAPPRDDKQLNIRDDRHSEYRSSDHRDSQGHDRRSPTHSRHQTGPRDDKQPHLRPTYHSSAYRGHRDQERRSVSHTHRSDVSRTSRGIREPSYPRQRHRLELPNTPEHTRSGSFYSLQQQTVKETPLGKVPVHGGSSGSTSYHHNRSSHTPPPFPPREPMVLAAQDAHKPDSGRTRERRSALERVNAPDLRDQLQGRTTSSGDSVRLLDVEILYDGDTAQENPMIPGSPPQANNELALVVAPASNRTPASQRLGGIASLSSREKTRLALANAVSNQVTDPLPAALAITGTKGNQAGSLLERRWPEARFRALN